MNIVSKCMYCNNCYDKKTYDHVIPDKDDVVYSHGVCKNLYCLMDYSFDMSDSEKEFNSFLELLIEG